MRGTSEFCLPTDEQKAVLEDVRTALEKRDGRGEHAASAWREINPAVRTAIVMLCCDGVRDARTFARQGWASYTDDQRSVIGSTAREFLRELAAAGALR